MRRNLLKRSADMGRNIIQKVFVKENSGAYGAVAMPSSADAINIRNDTNVDPQKSDEQSGARSNSRVRAVATRMKGKTAISIDADLDASGSASTEWGLGTILKLLLGKRTQNASAVAASVTMDDPSATVAGLTITAAGTYSNELGNLVDVTFHYAGNSGTATLDATKAPHYVVSYYGSSVVDDVISAIDADANLSCVKDSNGTSSTDLFSDLLVANARPSDGSVLTLSGGSPIGFQYDNSVIPSTDATIIANKENVGWLVSGSVLDKLTIEFGDKQPTAKIEGTGKYALMVGSTLVSANVSANTKIYIDDEKQFGDYDADAPQYIDIYAVDGKTAKASSRKITGKGFDTGWYVTVDSAVTCSAGDFIVFHEPASFNPKVAPLNGLSGSVNIDGIVYGFVKTGKLEFQNNHQLFDNLAFTSTLGGYNASKFLGLKFSTTMLVQKSKMALLRQAMNGSNVFTCPVIITIGSVSGKMMSIVLTKMAWKHPVLPNGAEDVQEVTLEAEAAVTPEFSGADICIITH